MIGGTKLREIVIIYNTQKLRVRVPAFPAQLVAGDRVCACVSHCLPAYIISHDVIVIPFQA